VATLYRLHDDGSAHPCRPVRTRNEAEELQELLARNLFLLPGDQIKPEDPRRWMLIRREMPVPDPSGSGSRWSLDLLLTDQDGMPTFVECKRYADTRARREVVGQMLEYAANGHYYWDHGEIRGFVEETARELGHSADRLFAELRSEQFGDLDGLIETFIQHLRQGTVRLVFFMEQAPQELKSIVDFLNSQTERTEVLIVEARQFDVEGRRFVVPTLFIIGNGSSSLRSREVSFGRLH
jgi:ribosomal protein L30E